MHGKIQLIISLTIAILSSCVIDNPPDSKQKSILEFYNDVPERDNLQRLQPLIEGYWIPRQLAQQLRREPSMQKARPSWHNPIELYFDLEFYANDTLTVPVMLNNGQRKNLTVLFQKSDKRTVFRLHGINNDFDYQLYISLFNGDTTLVMRKSTTNGQLIKVTEYERIGYKTNKVQNVRNLMKFLNLQTLNGKYLRYSPDGRPIGACSFYPGGFVSGLDSYERFYTGRKWHELPFDHVELRSGSRTDWFLIEADNGLIKLFNTKTVDGELVKGELGYILKKQYKILQKSATYEEEIVNLTIKDHKTELEIDFSVAVPNSYDYSVDSLYNKIVRSGYFNFKFFHDNQIIPVSHIFSKEILGNWYSESKYLFFTELGNKEQTRNFHQRIILPKYVFHNLPAGMQNITLYVYQKDFSRALEDSRLENIQRVEIDPDKNYIYAKISFQMHIPTIYHTKLRMEHISVDESKAKDFRLSKKSANVDVYWQLFYQGQSKSYFRSNIARKSRIYKQKDVVDLYHLESDPTLAIGVYDYDRIFSHDILGVWTGKLSELEQSMQNTHFLNFEAVQRLQLTITKKGAVHANSSGTNF